MIGEERPFVLGDSLALRARNEDRRTPAHPSPHLDAPQGAEQISSTFDGANQTLAVPFGESTRVAGERGSEEYAVIVQTPSVSLRYASFASSPNGGAENWGARHFERSGA